MKIFRGKNQRGLTLVELVMTIIIASVVLAPTSIITVASIRGARLPEHYAIASSLLEREIERVGNLRFSAVVNEGPTAYTGNFSSYSYQVSFSYVNSANLNVTVAGATDFKRATVTISSPGLPALSAVTIVTNHF